MAIPPLSLRCPLTQAGGMTTSDTRDSTPGRDDRDDPHEDFARREVAVDGVVKRVLVAGRGPAVVLMPEMPGISPDVLRLARWIRDAGFTVYVPSLFGRDGAYPTAEGYEVAQRACVSKEFRAFAGGGTSPVTVWLRGLARVAHAECGGPGVGAVGLCFTGNFALTMTLEPAVVAPVVNHPSLPLDDPGGLELDEADQAAVRERVDRDGLTVLAYRFDDDRWCTGQRFAAYRRLLGTPSTGACCQAPTPTLLPHRSSSTWCRRPTAWSPPTSSTRPATPRWSRGTRSSRSSATGCAWVCRNRPPRRGAAEPPGIGVRRPGSKRPPTPVVAGASRQAGEPRCVVISRSR